MTPTTIPTTTLVTGATGTVGSHVVRALAERGMPLRAFVRDPRRGGEILGEGVDLSVGGLPDRGSIERAVAGVGQVFLACGNVPDQEVFECAVIDAARAAGVRRIVKLSGPAASIDSPLVFERRHGRVEQYLRDSGVPWVMLQPRTYLTNLLVHARTVAETGMLFAPAGTAEISFIDPRDVADVAATVLDQGRPGIDDGRHDGRTYTLTGPEAVTFARIAAELGAAVGRPVVYVDVPDDDARHGLLEAGLPAPMADAIVDIFASQRGGSMRDTTDTVRTLLGREPRTLTGFARDYRDLFRPTAAHA